MATPTPVPSTPRFSVTHRAPIAAPVLSSAPSTLPVEAHAPNARQAGDADEAPHRDLGDHRIDARQPASDPPTRGRNLRFHLGDVGCADDHADRAVSGGDSPLQDGIELARGRDFAGR